MSNDIADPGHGHSPAAWTAVVIMLVAVAIGTMASSARHAVARVGLGGPARRRRCIVGWIMAKVGYGVDGTKYTPKAH